MKPGKEKYRLLVENMPDAFAYHRIVADESGKPVDFVFLHINTAFEKMTGLKKDYIIGSMATAVLPGLRDSAFDWIGTYGEVALTGESACFEQYLEPLQRWYEVTAYSDEPGYFAAIFRDISHRKQENEALGKLVRMAEKFQQLPPGKMDYQLITDGLLSLSGAKYVIFNAYTDDNQKVVTRAVSGSAPALRRAAELLGFNPVGKEWPLSPEQIQKIRRNHLTLCENLHSAACGALPRALASLLEKSLQLGDIYLVNLAYGDRTLGDFIFFMGKRKGDKIHNPWVIELYARQVTLAILNMEAEEVLRSREQYSRWGMEMLSYLAESDELPWVIQIFLLKILEITGFVAGAVCLHEGDNYSFAARDGLTEQFIHDLNGTPGTEGLCAAEYKHKKVSECILKVHVRTTDNKKTFQSSFGSILVDKAGDLDLDLCLGNKGKNICAACVQPGYETIVRIPLKTGQETVGYFHLHHQQAHALDDEGLGFLESVVQSLSYAIKHMQVQNSLKESYHKNQLLSSKLLRAYERERARLARELHDEVGQTLTAFKLDIQLLERDLQQPGVSVGRRLAKSINLIDTVMDLVHKQAVSLRPPALTDMGLVVAVRNMTEGFSRRTGISVCVTDENWGKQRFSNDVETALFRCVQESLTNVFRHAGAGRVEIVFSCNDIELALQIKDNGIGFNPDALTDNEEHIGLIGMQERVELINGTFRIISQPGEGTLIDIKVKLLPPFQADRKG